MLEVGCGSGHYISYLKNTGFRLLVGVDISYQKLRYLKEVVGKAELIVCDAQQLPFNQNCFDLVLCSEVIEHLIKPESALKEISYVCSKLTVISTPTKTTFYRLLLQYLGIKKNYGGTHIRELSQQELRQELLKCSFSIKELVGTPIIEFLGLYTLVTKFPARYSIAKMLYRFNRLLYKIKPIVRFGVFTCILCEKT